MAFKFVFLAAALACANAGLIGAPLGVAPVAHYSAAPAVSSSYIHQAQAAPVAAYAHAAPVATYAQAAPIATYAQAAPIATYAHAAPVATYAHAAPLSIGSSQQSVLRSLGGNQAVSHYSKAVDSAYSSVRKFDTRITNDALSVAPVAAYAHAAPVATYAHAAPVVSSYSHAAPLVSSYAHAAPVVSSYAHAAPVATYAHAAPVATYAHAAPVATYAQAAPVLKSGLGVAYSPAAVVSHATFSGLGASYSW